MASEAPNPLGGKALLSIFDPLRFLSEFWKKQPNIAKYIYAGLAAFSAAALVMSINKNLFSLTVTAVIIVMLGLLIFLIAKAMKGRGLERLGKIVAYALMGILGLCLVLLISAVAFGRPSNGADLLAQLLNSTEVLSDPNTSNKPVTITTTTSIQSLPRVMLLPPSATTNVERALEIRKLPELVIQGGTLTLAGPDDHRVLATSKLILTEGGIETNGGTLTIYADTIETNGGFIRAFPPGSKAAAGSNGRGAGKVHLNVVRDIRGVLKVTLDGESGGVGKDGATGQTGTDSPAGDESHYTWRFCDNADDGKRGGMGHDGLPGGNGGAGGAGGELVLTSAFANRLSASIVLTDKAGSPGEGGAGGMGGRGGKGGAGGHGHRGCHSGNDGPMGGMGANGEVGNSGASGSDGPGLILRRPE